MGEAGSDKEQGACMWPYAIVNGVRMHISEVARKQHGVCPVCQSELVARKGDVRAEHWWHVNGKRCDAWYQPKGPWHCYWQNMFPKEWQEVVVEKEVDGLVVRHIADVKTERGVILEVQYSPISIEDIAIRERFYNNMLWLVNMRRTETDSNVLAVLKRNEAVDFGSIHAWVVTEQGLSETQKWYHAQKPVVFDFFGDFMTPESEEDLYCLLPRVDSIDEVRICIQVERCGLIAALRGGFLGRMLLQWKEAMPEILKKYQEREREEEENRRLTREREHLRYEKELQWSRERDKWIAERREEEREHREAVFNELQRLDVQPELIDAFLSGRFDRKSQMVLSLDWIEAYLISRNVIIHDVGIPLELEGVVMPKMGRVVLHYRHGYTEKDFARDLGKAHECIDARICQTLDYTKMCKLGGKVVAAVDYLILNNAYEGIVFAGARKLRREFDLKMDCVGFTRLSAKQSSYFSSADSVYAPRCFF